MLTRDGQRVPTGSELVAISLIGSLAKQPINIPWQEVKSRMLVLQDIKTLFAENAINTKSARLDILKACAAFRFMPIIMGLVAEIAVYKHFRKKSENTWFASPEEDIIQKFDVLADGVPVQVKAVADRFRKTEIYKTPLDYENSVKAYIADRISKLLSQKKFECWHTVAIEEIGKTSFDMYTRKKLSDEWNDMLGDIMKFENGAKIVNTIVQAVRAIQLFKNLKEFNNDALFAVVNIREITWPSLELPLTDCEI